MSLVIAENVTKIYQAGDVSVKAIREIGFEIKPASFVCFVGPSGSGKSTLLNMIGFLDPPSSGRLSVANTETVGLSRQASAAFRGENIGYIFQEFNLISVLTAHENIEYPLLMVQNWPAQKRKERVQTLLGAAGMADQANKRPDQLSGGQKQRVAVARALATNPKLILADEPTANLDHKTAYRIIDLMKNMRDEYGTTFIFSTHDPKIVGEAELIYELEDGLIVGQNHPGGSRD